MEVVPTQMEPLLRTSGQKLPGPLPEILATQPLP